MSAPAQKNFSPAPVMSSTCTSGSKRASSTCASSCFIISYEYVFAAGLVSSSTITPSCFEAFTRGIVMRRFLTRAQGTGARSLRPRREARGGRIPRLHDAGRDVVDPAVDSEAAGLDPLLHGG